MQKTTVKVSNVSLGATERDIKEFFSFSGDIEYVEMQRLKIWPSSLMVLSSLVTFSLFMRA